MSEMSLSRFLQVVGLMREATIDEIVAAMRVAGFFPPEWQASAVASAEKAMARKMLQSARDATDMRLFASTEVEDEDGVKRKVYKQVEAFDVTDCDTLIDYHTCQAETHMKRANFFVRQKGRLTGAQLNLPFPDVERSQ